MLASHYSQHRTILPTFVGGLHYQPAGITPDVIDATKKAMLDSATTPGTIGSPSAITQNNSIRKVDIAMISNPIVNTITQELSAAVNDVCVRSFGLQANPCGAYGFFIYKAPDSHYEFHSDNGHLYEDGTFVYDYPCRNISMVYYLNEEFVGGALEIGERHGQFYTENQITIKPRRDHLLLFPSDIRYPHRVHKTLQGTRLAIVNWFSLQGQTDATARDYVINKTR